MKMTNKDTIIYSDSWCAYKTKEFKNGDFEISKVNHKYSFMDPDIGTHT